MSSICVCMCTYDNKPYSQGILCVIDAAMLCMSVCIHKSFSAGAVLHVKYFWDCSKCPGCCFSEVQLILQTVSSFAVLWPSLHVSIYAFFNSRYCTLHLLQTYRKLYMSYLLIPHTCIAVAFLSVFYCVSSYHQMYICILLLSAKAQNATLTGFSLIFGLYF